MFSSGNFLYKSQNFTDKNTAILKHRVWLEEFKQKVKEEGVFDGKSQKNMKKNEGNRSFEEEKAQIERYFSVETEKPENEENVENIQKEVFSFVFLKNYMRFLKEKKPEFDAECEELVDFMHNLNYEDFIKDLEVCSLIKP